MKLLDDRVLVQPIGADDKIGNIVLPDSAKEKSQRGRVLAVGPGKFYPEVMFRNDEGNIVGGRRPLPVNVGDVILYGKFRGETHKHEGEECVILYEHDIIAVLEEGAKS